MVLPATETLTLTAEVSGAASLRLAWTPVDDAEASSVWLYVKAPNKVSWAVQATFPISQTAATLTGLAAGDYRLGILARDATYTGVARSNDITVTVPMATNQSLYLPIVSR